MRPPSSGVVVNSEYTTRVSFMTCTTAGTASSNSCVCQSPRRTCPRRVRIKVYINRANGEPAESKPNNHRFATVATRHTWEAGTHARFTISSSLKYTQQFEYELAAFHNLGSPSNLCHVPVNISASYACLICFREFDHKPPPSRPMFRGILRLNGLSDVHCHVVLCF